MSTDESVDGTNSFDLNDFTSSWFKVMRRSDEATWRRVLWLSLDWVNSRLMFGEFPSDSSEHSIESMTPVWPITLLPTALAFCSVESDVNLEASKDLLRLFLWVISFSWSHMLQHDASVVLKFFEESGPVTSLALRLEPHMAWSTCWSLKLLYFWSLLPLFWTVLLLFEDFFVALDLSLSTSCVRLWRFCLLLPEISAPILFLTCDLVEI